MSTRTLERPAASAVRSGRQSRRFSSRTYKLLLTTHILAGVGWAGIVVGKLALGLAAATAGGTDRAASLYLAVPVVDTAFPPAAVATAVTGVLLSLGTRWGLLRYYWVTTKLALTVAVIVTAVALSDRFLRQAVATAGDSGALLLALSGTHLLMLVVATVLSVYKPWGRARPAR